MTFEEECAALKAMGYTHAVRLNKDVSVICVGAIVSAFKNKLDAKVEAARLCAIYEVQRRHAFMMVEL